MTAAHRAGRAARWVAWPARAAIAFILNGNASAVTLDSFAQTLSIPGTLPPTVTARTETAPAPPSSDHGAALDKPPHPLLAPLVPQLKFGFHRLRPNAVQRATQLAPSADPRNFSGRYSPAEATLLLPGERGRMASYTDRGARTFLARAEEVVAGKPRPDPLALCKPPGPVRALNRGFTVQIMQSADELTIVHMEDHQVRHVRIGGPREAQPAPTLTGTSRGHWEGNTLVVETRAFRDGAWLDEYGNPGSEQLMLLERFSKQPNGSLRIEATINDPVYYSEPLRMVRNWTWTPNVAWSEMICEATHGEALVGTKR